MKQSTPRKRGEIKTREELIYALSEAAELEHGLTCIYLFAAFSIKRATYEGIDSVQQDQLRNWESVILAVAKQEMEHLGLVCNMLNAIGAAQHFDRPNLPQPPKYYSTEGAFTLEKFSKKTMRRFLEYEKPAPTDTAQGAVIGDELVPDPIHIFDHHTVQELYESIRKGFINLDAYYKSKEGESLFIGPEKAQLVDDEIVVGYGNREYGITMVEVTDLKSALDAIDLIVEQGEGIDLGGHTDTPVQKKVHAQYVVLNKLVEDLEVLRKTKIPLPVWILKTEALGNSMRAVMDLVISLINDDFRLASQQLTEFRDDLDRELSNLDAATTQKSLRRIQKRILNIGKYDAEGLFLSIYIEPDCHYLKFWKVYQEMKDIRYQPARNVAKNPALRHHEDNAGHRITVIDHPYSRKVEEVFNASYETMVQMLIIVFSYNNISDTDRKLLINTAFFPFMTMVIRPLSEVITQLPAHPLPADPDALRAGPAFEYYDNIAFLPNQDAGYIYLVERLNEISAYSQKLSPPPAELKPFVEPEAFDYIGKTMATFAVNIKRIAENFNLGINPPK
jgi:rubrerythrin